MNKKLNVFQTVILWLCVLLDFVDNLQIENRNLKSEKEVMEKALKDKDVDLCNITIFRFPKKAFVIRTEGKNEKDKKTFHTSLPCWENSYHDLLVKYPYNEEVRNNTNGNYLRAEGSAKKFIEAVLKTKCVAIISAENAYKFTITKPGSLTWEEVIPKVNKALVSLFEDIKEEEKTASLPESVKKNGPSSYDGRREGQ